MTIEPIDLDTPDITADRLAALRDLIPEAFSEGKVDFDKLRAALGDVVDERPERYSFTWAGKRDAIRLLQTPSSATLVPAREESVNWETTQHLFIEGDNLEVLKLLYKAYFGKVKLIYIDPPYNTGNDFVYPDDFADPLGRYLEVTGQKDAAGNLLTSNPETSGRYHSAWLNMMYPRLFMARQLLADDGIMFISIDEREAANLRMLVNEVFGEENVITNLVWQSKKGGGSDNVGLVNDHEYVLVVVKSNNSAALARILIDSEPLDKHDAKGPYRKGRELNKWGANSRRIDRPTMFFPIPGPNGEDVYPIRNDGIEGCWRWGKPKMMAIVQAQDVEYERRADGNFTVYEKIRSTDPRTKPYRTWLTDVGITADGSKVIKGLFEGVKIFSFPKPVQLLKHLLELGSSSEEDIVLDFFAGSCTLAQAVLEHNCTADVRFRFICVQIPEPTQPDSEAARSGLSSIADIGKVRIRRVIERLRNEDTNQLPIANDIHQDKDLGFRVFKLAPSTLRAWRGTAAPTPAEYVEQLALLSNPLAEGWRAEDVVWEVAIKEGFPLTSAVSTAAVAGQQVWRVADADSGRVIHVCLDDVVTAGVAEALGLGREDVLVVRDAAVDDTTAANLTLQCRLKTL